MDRRELKENYTKEVQCPTGLYGKIFIQPFRTQRMYVHLALGRNDLVDIAVTQDHELYCPNIGKLLYQYKNNRETLYPYIWVNHYVTRSFEEWFEKIKRGTCDPNFKRKFNLYFLYNPELNYLKEDKDIQKFLNTIQPYKA